jgi:hypothetical protein
MTWRHRLLSGLRTAAAALLFGFCVSAVVAPFESPAAGADPVSISGSGSWSVGDGTVFGPLSKWLDAMATATTPVNVDYLPVGSGQGNDALLGGNSDFAITGVPITADQEKSFAPGLIRVPLEATGMQLLLSPSRGFQVYQLNPARPDCTIDSADPTCLVLAPFDGDPAHGGAIPLLPEAFGGLALRVTGDGGTWGGPDVIESFHEVTGRTYAGIAYPLPLMTTIFSHRSDGSSYNLMLQQYISRAAPNAWAQVKADFPALPWDPNSDQLARITGTSGDGVPAQLSHLKETPGDNFSSGVMADVPPWGQAYEAAKASSLPIRQIELKNAAGQWVVPTSDSITKAVAAGGSTPLYAMDHPVDGAWPMAWVNELDAPASGLSIETANALAAFIRYVVTDGQDVAVAAGDGRLSPALVQQALAGANQLVKSNCVGADRQVVTGTGAGPHAPNRPGLNALTDVATCTPVAPPTTTTAPTATVPTTTTSSAPRPSSTTSSSVAAAVTTTPTTEFRRATTPVGGGGTRSVSTTRPPPPRTTAPTASAAAPGPPSASAPSPPPASVAAEPETTTTAPPVALPMPLPDDGRGGVDRTTTMLLGSGAFLIGRRGVLVLLRLL